jgi:hypothetical protein
MNGVSCTEKHRRLESLLAEIGIPVRYVDVSFRWYELEELGVQYPPELCRLSTKLSLSYHLHCQVLRGRWLDVDATWDAPLAAAGFPISVWHGDDDCMLAVKPVTTIVYTLLTERQRFVERLRDSYTASEQDARMRFYIALNEWLVDVRSGQHRS